MARYEIVFHNGYGLEIDSMVVTAPSMAVALTISANLLHTGAVRAGEQAVSAAVEEQGVYDQEEGPRRLGMHELLEAAGIDPEVYEANLHSVRASLHEEAWLLDLAPPHPSTGTED